MGKEKAVQNQPEEQEDCKPLTDEEFREYQEKDARTTNKVLKFFKVIWEAVNFFSCNIYIQGSLKDSPG